MAEAVLLVMLVGASLYAVLGGADFGAGMVEVFLGRRHQERIDAALLPVWEANHVWLVLLVVVSFVGFPQLFGIVSTYLHIPILLVLLGIVARGSAFTFRHYDPAPGALFAWYTWVFRAGSALTPLFLGIIAAALVQGRISTDSSRDFYTLFVAPWNTPFCWAAGLFTCALFAFEGAALLSAEQSRAHRPLLFLRFARALHVTAIVTGGAVFVCAWLSDLAWFHALLRSPLSLGAIFLATLFIPVVARAFMHGRPWVLRLATGAQVVCVLIGFFGAQFPALMLVDGKGLLLADVQAPDATLRTLCWALGVGLALIVPALYFLLKVYKGSDARA